MWPLLVNVIHSRYLHVMASSLMMRCAILCYGVSELPKQFLGMGSAEWLVRVGILKLVSFGERSPTVHAGHCRIPHVHQLMLAYGTPKLTSI